MVCIYCGAETHVFNSRPQKRLNQIWRRRRCYACGAVFSTEESADYTSAWTVAAPDGLVTAFSRDKLFLSLYKSCGHRPSAQTDASALTGTVMKKLIGRIQDGTVTSRVISQVCQVALTRFDQAASVHYAAFHKN